jgi:hypothetical protein
MKYIIIYIATVIALLKESECIAVNKLNIRAPSVFRADEEEMHKYSAVLAATEPFRNLCNTQIKMAISPFKYLILLLKGVSTHFYCILYFYTVLTHQCYFYR